MRWPRPSLPIGPRQAWRRLSSIRPFPSGALLRGVRVVADQVETESIVMRSRSGTVRKIVAQHPLAKMQSLMKGARR